MDNAESVLLQQLEDLFQMFDVNNIDHYQDLIIYLHCNSNILGLSSPPISQKLNELISSIFDKQQTLKINGVNSCSCNFPQEKTHPLSTKDEITPRLLSVGFSEYMLKKIFTDIK